MAARAGSTTSAGSRTRCSTRSSRMRTVSWSTATDGQCAAAGSPVRRSAWPPPGSGPLPPAQLPSRVTSCAVVMMPRAVRSLISRCCGIVRHCPLSLELWTRSRRPEPSAVGGARATVADPAWADKRGGRQPLFGCTAARHVDVPHDRHPWTQSWTHWSELRRTGRQPVATNAQVRALYGRLRTYRLRLRIRRSGVRIPQGALPIPAGQRPVPARVASEQPASK